MFTLCESLDQNYEQIQVANMVMETGCIAKINNAQHANVIIGLSSPSSACTIHHEAAKKSILRQKHTDLGLPQFQDF